MKKRLTYIFLLLSGIIFAQEETVEDVHKNVGDTLNNATEIVSFTKVITIFVVLVLTWGLIKLFNWFFKNMVKNFNRHRLKILRIQPVINILVWTLAIYTLIVTLFNPSAEAIYALMGSSALALGFALQDILKNVFGGLLIILDRPFQIGDRINIKGNYGEVVNIGLRNTQVNTLDDNLVTIPNSAIISDSISNANSGALDCMVVINLWLPVNVNITKVRKIAQEAAITSRYLNIDKPVTILFFDHFDDHAATKVLVKAYVLDARYEKLFEGDVTEAAKKAFIEAGIYQ
ncbi:small-conductance mechanosensitive channel [Lutibacter sp. Hel_I_33_5]|uniref:mechanosensitive ion channel family protein n=1 Tax=Lutibacter sp. Hel_I_33_5 TaxID=1566289 RepID=UPI0011A9C8F9|nr:mechanosensitive ion channel domain-containing protein [Lutibacter sp. Hel_I_33_5]TVZ56105.1 small-conductance mechanosensitive channel [Lutibacter sp. Hel_I_33_5]